MYATQNSIMEPAEIRETQKEIVRVILGHTNDLQLAKMLLENINLDEFAKLKVVDG
ncbi:hypothetical protein [Lacticaseibacillus parakribbianus]|uniref:hypothetical protein n=1 Tax=Lacticaseibacillus parakribbianus TaxID=2970927 RepID=UPI0021CB8E4D|nr:hypothetical protein [Lacticaseibacillus parakribbianus]